MEKEYINEKEFAEIREKAFVIDVRSKLEHQTLKTFPASVNIPYENLISQPEKYIADKNELVVIYCILVIAPAKPLICFARKVMGKLLFWKMVYMATPKQKFKVNEMFEKK